MSSASEELEKLRRQVTEEYRRKLNAIDDVLEFAQDYWQPEPSRITVETSEPKVEVTNTKDGVSRHVYPDGSVLETSDAGVFERDGANATERAAAAGQWVKASDLPTEAASAKPRAPEKLLAPKLLEPKPVEPKPVEPTDVEERIAAVVGKREGIETPGDDFRQPGPAASDPILDAEPIAAEEPAEEDPVDDTPGKWCVDCEDWKPLDEFGKNRNRKDGREARCRPCKREKERAWREKRQAAKRDRQTEAIEEISEIHQEAVEYLAKEAAEEWAQPAGDVATRQPIDDFGRPRPPDPIGGEKPQSIRVCANGEECLETNLTGSPARLNQYNTGPLCYRCEEAEREDENARAPQGPIVRKRRGE